MATENIVSKKYRILSDVVNKVWDVISFFTLAKDVETTNGNNLETTCGSITGITSSLTSTSTTMAASASAIKELNDKIADLNSNLGDKLFDNISTPAFVKIGDAGKGTSFVTSDTLEKGTYLVTCSTGYPNGYTLKKHSLTANDTDDILELYKSDDIVCHSQRHNVFIYKAKLNSAGQLTFSMTTDMANVNQKCFIHCAKLN